MSRSIAAGNLITSPGVGTLENAPRRIGRYALHSRLASGGMASVHLGRLLGPVGFARTVAIKRLHPQLIKERSFVSMLLDEARLAARIRHPNVVPVVDVVALEGELFLVMEYVHGETLARLLINAKNQAPPPDVITKIVVDLLNGLHAAHVATDEQGQPLNIVHRDVSPQNVLVGVDGIARVTDFGVAKAVNRLQSTNSGQVKGKLAYMAPEYLQGKGLDRRSDIYSASVLLWEGLTRRRLFARKNSTETMKLIVSGEVPPPSRFAPWLSPVLDEVVMQGLSRDPGKRFSSAQALAMALEEHAALALPPKVGAWVQEHAASELESRARSLAEVENVESDDPASLAGGAALVDAVMSTQPRSNKTNPGLSSTVLLNDYTPPEEPKAAAEQALAGSPPPAAGVPPPCGERRAATCCWRAGTSCGERRARTCCWRSAVYAPCRGAASRCRDRSCSTGRDSHQSGCGAPACRRSSTCGGRRNSPRIWLRSRLPRRVIHNLGQLPRTTRSPKLLLPTTRNPVPLPPTTRNPRQPVSHSLKRSGRHPLQRPSRANRASSSCSSRWLLERCSYSAPLPRSFSSYCRDCAERCTKACSVDVEALQTELAILDLHIGGTAHPIAGVDVHLAWRKFQDFGVVSVPEDDAVESALEEHLSGFVIHGMTLLLSALTKAVFDALVRRPDLVYVRVEVEQGPSRTRQRVVQSRVLDVEGIIEMAVLDADAAAAASHVQERADSDFAPAFQVVFEHDVVVTHHVVDAGPGIDEPADAIDDANSVVGQIGEAGLEDFQAITIDAYAAALSACQLQETTKASARPGKGIAHVQV